jgi:hypothetical protein
LFDRFKSKSQNEEPELTSLNLKTEVPARPSQGQNPQAPPAPPPGPCVQVSLSLEGNFNFYKELRRRREEFVASGVKLDAVFYLVFPQQGHTLTLSTPDGKRTILYLFTSKIMADGYLARRKLGAVAAGCRVSSLGEQVEKWATAGINAYGLNACAKCANAAVGPLSDLQSEQKFQDCWSLDAMNRRLFAETALRFWQQNMKDVAGYRKALEGIRDHVDPGCPYIHMLIAAIAGMQGDKESAAGAIQWLDRFGPPFTGKLNAETIMQATPEGWTGSAAEGMLGLYGAYGLANVPMKPLGPEDPRARARTFAPRPNAVHLSVLLRRDGSPDSHPRAFLS